jgi:hypothetical protein
MNKKVLAGLITAGVVIAFVVFIGLIYYVVWFGLLLMYLFLGAFIIGYIGGLYYLVLHIINQKR